MNTIKTGSLVALFYQVVENATYKSSFYYFKKLLFLVVVSFSLSSCNFIKGLGKTSNGSAKANQSLQDEIADKESQITALKQQIELIQQGCDNKDCHGEIAGLQEEIVDLESQIIALNAQLEDRNRGYENSNFNFTVLTTEFKELEKRNAELESIAKQVETVNRDNKDSNFKLTVLTEEFKGVESQNTNLVTQNKALKSQVEKLELGRNIINTLEDLKGMWDEEIKNRKAQLDTSEPYLSNEDFLISTLKDVNSLYKEADDEFKVIADYEKSIIKGIQNQVEESLKKEVTPLITQDIISTLNDLKSMWDEEIENRKANLDTSEPFLSNEDFLRSVREEIDKIDSNPSNLLTEAQEQQITNHKLLINNQVTESTKELITQVRLKAVDEFSARLKEKTIEFKLTQSVDIFKGEDAVVRNLFETGQFENVDKSVDESSKEDLQLSYRSFLIDGKMQIEALYTFEDNLADLFNEEELQQMIAPVKQRLDVLDNQFTADINELTALNDMHYTQEIEADKQTVAGRLLARLRLAFGPNLSKSNITKWQKQVEGFIDHLVIYCVCNTLNSVAIRVDELPMNSDPENILGLKQTCQGEENTKDKEFYCRVLYNDNAVNQMMASE